METTEETPQQKLSRMYGFMMQNLNDKTVLTKEFWAEMEVAKALVLTDFYRDLDTPQIGKMLYGIEVGEMYVGAFKANRNSTEIILTQDGGGYSPAWHKSDYNGPTIFVEVWEKFHLTDPHKWHRMFHGYVHPNSRKIVQAG